MTTSFSLPLNTLLVSLSSLPPFFFWTLQTSLCHLLCFYSLLLSSHSRHRFPLTVFNTRLLLFQCPSRLVWSQEPSSGWCSACWCSLWSSTTWWGSWWRAASSASVSGQWPACGRRRSASQVCARDWSRSRSPSLASTPAWPSWHSCHAMIWLDVQGLDLKLVCWKETDNDLSIWLNLKKNKKKTTVLHRSKARWLKVVERKPLSG